MTLKAIPKTDLTCILNTWEKEYRVLIPQRGTDGFTEFGEWDGDGTGFLDGYRNTVVPGKTLFLPPFEELFRFKKGTSGHSLEIPAAPERKTLVFGIRPCDARALSLLDKVLAGRMPDPYYLPRRERTLLVGLGCRQPYDTCFCTSLDGDPFNSRDVDLLLTDTGREFVVKVSTRAGAALLDEGMPVGEAGPAAEARSSRIATAARKQITRHLDKEAVRDRLAAVFEDEGYWMATAARCISCGICTLMCPTCHCFDMNDEISGGRGSRFRSTDSCSFPGYTRMPAENPRYEKWRRLRNRIGHKYLFYPKNYGLTACTGCGRCIRLCPVNWDISRVLNELTLKVS